MRLFQPKKKHDSADRSSFVFSLHQDWKSDVQDDLSDPMNKLLAEYDHVLWRFEICLIMHKLAMRYYEFRAFWFTFFPILAVTTLVSICGFLLTAETSSGETKTGVISKENLSLSVFVGMLGILSTFLASLGKHLNYQSKADMHSSAATTLSDICDDREELQLWRPISNSPENENTSLSPRRGGDNTEQLRLKTESQKEQLRLKIETQKAKFEAIEKACSDPIPDPIKQAFNTLKEYTTLVPYGVKRNLYRLYYTELWREFSKRRCFCRCFRMFPWRIPEIDVREKFKFKVKGDYEGSLWGIETGISQVGKKNSTLRLSFTCEESDEEAPFDVKDKELSCFDARGTTNPQMAS